MNQWEFRFEPEPWEAALSAVAAGGSLSAAQFLTILESEPEETVEAAVQLLDEKDILLELSGLDVGMGADQTALRLRREKDLASQGKIPQALEENDPLRLYLEEIAGLPACGDPQKMAEDYLAGDEGVIPQLVNNMLSRVIQGAFSLAGQGVLLLDLIQEGSLGLWQGILSYSGGDFYAHCDRWIQRTLAKTVVLQARENGVGRKLYRALEDYCSADEQLLTELGRNPTLEEIAEKLHMHVEEAAAVAETLEAARRLQQVRPEEREAPAEEAEQAVEDTAYFQMRQRIQELLSSLPEQDAKLLTLRFGLEGGMPMTPEQVGRQLGLTPEEAVARETAALTLLRTNG